MLGVVAAACGKRGRPAGVVPVGIMEHGPTTSASSNPAGRGARALVRGAVRRHWRSLGLGGLGAVLVTIADLASPFPLAWVIDRVLENRSGPFEFSRDDVRLLALLVQAVIAIAIVSALGSYLADLSLQRAGEQITHELRVRTYEHLQRMSLVFHDRRRTGDLVTRLTGDVNAVGSLFSSVIGSMVQAGLVLVGMAAVALWLDPLLAIVLFAASPVLSIVTVGFRKRIRAAARDQRHAEAEIASLASESLSAMRVVKAFGTEEYEQGRVLDHSEARWRVGVVAATLDARFGGIVDVLGAVTGAAVLAFGAVRVSDGALTVGGLVIFLQYGRRVYRPLRDLAKYSTAASRSMARAERIADVLAADDTLEERPGAYAGERAAGALTLEGVWFGYDDQHPVVRGVDLTVHPGETLAVVGSSGSGKSTIGALVARFYDPSAGRVLIDGRDARDCSLQWLREQVGFLLQDTVLFSGTIAENIAYGQEASRDAIVRAATAADAGEFVARLPSGYDTALGAQGVGLSGGQRQRIGVARVLLRDPPILVLDEPTTGLDATSEAQMIGGIEGLMGGRTCVLITHSLALAQRADRVIVIADGIVVQEGRPDQLLGTPGPYRQLASMQGLVGRRRTPASSQDAALPAMRHLLDPDAIAPSLQRTLGNGRHVDDVRIHDVRYRPARRLTVEYRVDVDGETHDAVAMIDAGDVTELAALDIQNLAATAAVNGRTPARIPLALDGRLGALIQWLPLDIQIPATWMPPDDLAELLRAAGAPIAEGGGEPPYSGYRPRRRLVFDFGESLVTCWGRDVDATRAANATAHAARLGLLGDGAQVRHLATLQACTRPGLRGAPITDAVAAAYDAGELLAGLHSLPSGNLEAVRPAHELLGATRTVGVLQVVLPDVRPRLDALVTRMIDTAPRQGALQRVTAHGGFRHRQLIRGDGGLRFGSVETLCSAPAATDLASYAVGAVEHPNDWPAADEALTRLLRGYGSVPRGLDWYLATAILRRAIRPFRSQQPDWAEQVEGLVSLAESVFAE